MTTSAERPGSRRRVLPVLAVALIAGIAWLFLWRVHTEASRPVAIGGNLHGYTVQNFRVRSPLRVVSDTLDFMPHGAADDFGPDWGHRAYLFRDGRRIERLHFAPPPASAAVRDDGAFYAIFPRTNPPSVEVVRVRDGERLAFEVPAWHGLHWASDERVVVRQRQSDGSFDVFAELELPPGFLR